MEHQNGGGILKNPPKFENYFRTTVKTKLFRGKGALKMLRIAYLTMHIVYCILNYVYCILYIELFILYILYCILNYVCCILYNVF